MPADTSVATPALSRSFSAAFFTVAAFCVAALLTPFLWGFFSESYCATCPLQGNRYHVLLWPLPFLAACCAHLWTRLLHPGGPTVRYGAVRGLFVGVLSYLSFTAMFALYRVIVLPPSATTSWHVEPLLLLVAFLYPPLAYLPLAVAVWAGAIRLGRLERQVASLRQRLRRAVQEVWAALQQDLAGTHRRALVTACASVGLMFTGAALALVNLRVDVVASGLEVSAAALLLPACWALMLGGLGWLAGRSLARRTSPEDRLRLTAASLGAALVSGTLLLSRTGM